MKRRIDWPTLTIAASLTALLVLPTAPARLTGAPAARAAEPSSAPTGGAVVTIRLRTFNDSGIGGKATLRSVDGLTTVAIRLTGPTAAYLAQISPGTCAALDAAAAIPLANAEPGRTSRTTVDLAMADLLAGSYAVAVRQPATEITALTGSVSIVACGEIARTAPVPIQPPVSGIGTAAGVASNSARLAALLGALAIVLAGGGIVLRRLSFPR